MTKLSKVLASIGCASILAVSMAATVSASTARPYGDYGVSVSDGWFGAKDTATAYITKCNCTPVDNWLAACIQIQYESGNSNHWTPSESSYYYDRGYNKNEARKSISEYNIRYANAYFEASCGSGSIHVYYDSCTS